MWVIKKHEDGGTTMLCICGEQFKSSPIGEVNVYFNKHKGSLRPRCPSCARPESTGDVRLDIALNTFRKGDALSDDDLHALLAFYGRIEESLTHLGEEFWLARKEVRTRLSSLESYQYWRLEFTREEKNVSD